MKNKMMKDFKYILILLGMFVVAPVCAQEQSADEKPVILYSGTPKKI